MTFRMSTTPLEVGAQFYGDALWGNIITGRPFEITGSATREEFVAQFAPGAMTAETQAFLEAHPVLWFYRTKPLENLIGWIAEACGSTEKV